MIQVRVGRAVSIDWLAIQPIRFVAEVAPNALDNAIGHSWRAAERRPKRRETHVF